MPDSEVEEDGCNESPNLPAQIGAEPEVMIPSSVSRYGEMERAWTIGENGLPPSERSETRTHTTIRTTVHRSEAMGPPMRRLKRC